MYFNLIDTILGQFCMISANQQPAFGCDIMDNIDN